MVFLLCMPSGSTSLFLIVLAPLQLILSIFTIIYLREKSHHSFTLDVLFSFSRIADILENYRKALLFTNYSIFSLGHGRKQDTTHRTPTWQASVSSAIIVKDSLVAKRKTLVLHVHASLARHTNVDSDDLIGRGEISIFT